MFVEEIDVIIGVSIWLSKNGWKIISISIPNNQKQSKHNQNKKLISTFIEEELDISEIELNANGPDIIAQQLNGVRLWKIECKGLGKGVVQTIKNSFDRAIASTVSYFDHLENVQIGIALPENDI